MLLYPLEKPCKESSVSAVAEEQVAGYKWSAVLQGICAELGAGSSWLSSPMGIVRNSNDCSEVSAVMYQLDLGI